MASNCEKEVGRFFDGIFFCETTKPNAKSHMSTDHQLEEVEGSKQDFASVLSDTCLLLYKIYDTGARRLQDSK